MGVVSMKQLLGSWRTLWSPDQKMEPENGSIHLYRTERHLHHRPAEDR